MADEVLTMEARLKNFISKELDNLQRDLKETESVAKKSFGGASKASNQFMDTVKGFVSAQAVIAGVRQGWRLLSNTMSSSIQMYGDQVRAERLLENALGKTSKKLLEQASALQEVTRFGDDVTISAMAQIAAFIKNEDQISRIIPIVQDLAEGAFNGQLAPAAQLVAKTLGSSVNALSRYGIAVEGAVGSTDRLESLIRGVTRTYGGHAEAVARDGTGPLIQWANAVGDLKEEFAKELLPTLVDLTRVVRSDVFPAIRDTIPLVTKGLEAIGKFTNMLGESVEILGRKAGGQSAVEVATAIAIDRAKKMSSEVEAQNALFKLRGDLLSKIERAEANIASLQEKGSGFGTGLLGRFADRKKIDEAKKNLEELKRAELEARSALSQSTSKPKVNTSLGTGPSILPEGNQTSDEDAEKRRKAILEHWASIDAEMQRQFKLELALRQKHDQEILDSKIAFKESEIALIRNEGERKREELALQQQLELEQIQGNEAAINILKDAHKNERKALERELTAETEKEAQERKKAEINAMNSVVGSVVGSMKTILGATEGQSEAIKTLMLAETWARGGAAIAAGIQKVTTTAKTWYEIIPGIASIVGTVSAMIGTSVATVKKAATGADYITNGPEMLMVGDNPGGRERVTVTPIGSPSASSVTNDNSSMNISFNIQDQWTGEKIIAALRDGRLRDAIPELKAELERV